MHGPGVSITLPALQNRAVSFMVDTELEIWPVSVFDHLSMQLMILLQATGVLAVAEAMVAILQKARQEILSEQRDLASHLTEAQKKKKAKQAGGSKCAWIYRL